MTLKDYDWRLAPDGALLARLNDAKLQELAQLASTRQD